MKCLGKFDIVDIAASANHIADPVVLNMAVKRHRFHTFFTIWTSKREPPLLRRMHPVQVISYFGQIHSGYTILHRTLRLPQSKTERGSRALAVGFPPLIP